MQQQKAVTKTGVTMCGIFHPDTFSNCVHLCTCAVTCLSVNGCSSSTLLTPIWLNISYSERKTIHVAFIRKRWERLEKEEAAEPTSRAQTDWDEEAERVSLEVVAGTLSLIHPAFMKEGKWVPPLTSSQTIAAACKGVAQRLTYVPWRLCVCMPVCMCEREKGTDEWHRP